MDVKQEFENLIDATLDELGGDLAASKQEVAEYAAERSLALATIIENNEPGLDQAVIAARNSVGLMAGLTAGRMAAATSNIWLGVVAGGLRMAAVALAGTPAGAVAGATAEVVDPPAAPESQTGAEPTGK